MTNKNFDPLYLCACKIAACINQFENNKHYIPMKLNELNTADIPSVEYLESRLLVIESTISILHEKRHETLKEWRALTGTLGKEGL